MAIERKKILLAAQLSDESTALRRALQRANFDVLWSEAGESAFKICLEKSPAAIISDLMPGGSSGMQLFKQVKSNFSTRHIPFVLVAEEQDREQRIGCMASGIDDYIPKPCYAEEVVARLETVLGELEIIEETRCELRHGFAGSLKEMNLLDLIQTLELGNKSGVIKLQRSGNTGYVYINNGQVYDSTMENFVGKSALYRMLTWLDGTFSVELKDIHTTKAIQETNREIIGEGVVRIDRWRQVSNLLPPLTTCLKLARLNNGHILTNSEREIAQLFDGGHPIFEIVDECKIDDIECLEIVNRLVSAGILEKQSEDSIPPEKSANVTLLTHDLIKINPIKNIYSRLGKLIKINTELKLTKVKQANEKKAPGVINVTSGKEKVKGGKLYLSKSDLMLIRQKLS